MKTWERIAWLGGLLSLPGMGRAASLEELTDTGLIGGGVLLFLVALVLLIVPRLFKFGVVIMLLADGLFVARIFFRGEFEQWVQAQGWGVQLEAMSRDSLRLYTLLAVLACLLSLLLLRSLGLLLVGEGRSQVRARPKAHKARGASARRFRDWDERGEPEPEPIPAPRKAARNNRFRVHDYLDQLDEQPPARDWPIR